MKQDFRPYKIGTVFNPFKISRKNAKPLYKEVEVKFPSRLNAMAIDPSLIAKNENLVYTPGEVVFSIKVYKKIKVRLQENFAISDRSKRKPLIRHAYLIMKKALGFKEGLYIDADNKNEIRHCGLGSSSALIASVASAINELYGRPIAAKDLIRYCAQNHGEEIEGNDKMINPVQCIGGSAASGIMEGGMLVLAGDSCVVRTMKIPNEYKVIIGIPQDFKEQDSDVMLKKEIESLDKFVITGKKFGLQIAYNIFHKMLPAMTKGDIGTIGDVIFDYRFNMGSIENCSFTYPGLSELAWKLAPLKKRGVAPILAISSVGPAIFAITNKLSICKKEFQKAKFKIIEVEIENGGYKKTCTKI